MKIKLHMTVKTNTWPMGTYHNSIRFADFAFLSFSLLIFYNFPLFLYTIKTLLILNHVLSTKKKKYFRVSWFRIFSSSFFPTKRRNMIKLLNSKFCSDLEAVIIYIPKSESQQKKFAHQSRIFTGKNWDFINQILKVEFVNNFLSLFVCLFWIFLI